jgi:hypothetical protein
MATDMQMQMPQEGQVRFNSLESTHDRLSKHPSGLVAQMSAMNIADRMQFMIDIQRVCNNQIEGDKDTTIDGAQLNPTGRFAHQNFVSCFKNYNRQVMGPYTGPRNGQGQQGQSNTMGSMQRNARPRFAGAQGFQPNAMQMNDPNQQQLQQQAPQQQLQQQYQPRGYQGNNYRPRQYPADQAQVQYKPRNSTMNQQMMPQQLPQQYNRSPRPPKPMQSYASVSQ